MDGDVDTADDNSSNVSRSVSRSAAAAAAADSAPKSASAYLDPHYWSVTYCDIFRARLKAQQIKLMGNCELIPTGTSDSQWKNTTNGSRTTPTSNTSSAVTSTLVTLYAHANRLATIFSLQLIL